MSAEQVHLNQIKLERCHSKVVTHTDAAELLVSITPKKVRLPPTATLFLRGKIMGAAAGSQSISHHRHAPALLQLCHGLRPHLLRSSSNQQPSRPQPVSTVPSLHASRICHHAVSRCPQAQLLRAPGVCRRLSPRLHWPSKPSGEQGCCRCPDPIHPPINRLVTMQWPG